MHWIKIYTFYNKINCKIIHKLSFGQVPSTNRSARKPGSSGEYSCWTSFSQSIPFLSRSLKISWTISRCLSVLVRPKWSVEMLNHSYTAEWMALYLSQISWQLFSDVSNKTYKLQTSNMGNFPLPWNFGNGNKGNLSEPPFLRPSCLAFVSVAVPYSSVPQI